MLSDKRHRSLAHLREILTVLAILAGGVWAVFLFVNEWHQKKLQWSVDYQPVIQLKLDLKSWHSPKDGYLIEAVVKVTNIGKVVDGLNLTKEPPFEIYPVLFDYPCKLQNAHSDQTIKTPINTDPWGKFHITFPQPHHKTLLLPGESQTYRILQQVPSSGIYYVQFKVPLSEKSLAYWPDDQKQEFVYWSTGKFVEVVEHK